MAETTQKRKKVFQVFRVRVVPRLLSHRGKTEVGRSVCEVLGPSSCAKCTKPLEDMALVTWVTQQVQPASCTREAADCWSSCFPTKMEGERLV